jgi:hypothetical protein
VCLFVYSFLFWVFIAPQHTIFELGSQGESSYSSERQERETRRGNLNWSPTFTHGSSRGERRTRKRESRQERERDGTGGREERPEEVRNFRGRDFLFSKKKIKKQKPSPQQKNSEKVAKK